MNNESLKQSTFYSKADRVYSREIPQQIADTLIEPKIYLNEVFPNLVEALQKTPLLTYVNGVISNLEKKLESAGSNISSTIQKRYQEFKKSQNGSLENQVPVTAEETVESAPKSPIKVFPQPNTRGGQFNPEFLKQFNSQERNIFTSVDGGIFSSLLLTLSLSCLVGTAVYHSANSPADEKVTIGGKEVIQPAFVRTNDRTYYSDQTTPIR